MSISGSACVGPVGEAQTSSLLYLTIDITAFKKTRKHSKRNTHMYICTYVERSSAGMHVHTYGQN